MLHAWEYTSLEYDIALVFGTDGCGLLCCTYFVFVHIPLTVAGTTLFLLFITSKMVALWVFFFPTVQEDRKLHQMALYSRQVMLNLLWPRLHYGLWTALSQSLPCWWRCAWTGTEFPEQFYTGQLTPRLFIQNTTIPLDWRSATGILKLNLVTLVILAYKSETEICYYPPGQSWWSEWSRKSK